MHNRIEDYALIGDCGTAALVCKDGSIDWLCWPRFDSGALFASILGTPDNGQWRIAPAACISRISRRYLTDTLVLETDFETADGGAATLVDFMPPRHDGASHLVRIVRGRRGRVSVHSRLAIRFDYGSLVPWETRLGPKAIKAIAGPDMVLMRSDRSFEAEGLSHVSSFTLEPGESAHFVLSYAPSFTPIPEPVDPEAALRSTIKAWRSWSAKFVDRGPYSHHVSRSLITLKALTYHPTGGIVAAPSTSLPEWIGGPRNWDYRYCWLRDATFTLLALLNSGFTDEARAWRTWLRHAVAGNPAQVQIMYGLAGERRLDEWQIEWLPGYRRSGPVRIGNAAAKQLQLDIFGEVMDVLYQAECAGLSKAGFDWDLQLQLVKHLESIWMQPDEGIWEVRGGHRHFTYSKVMAWVAIDRAIKSIEKFGVTGPIARWRRLRDRIHRQVCRRGYDDDARAFVQAYGSPELDASALLMPLVGFLPPDDPRIASTVEAIGRRLTHHGLIRRYEPSRAPDGVEGSEGAFLACSFWYVDCLVLLGRRDEACELFERLLDHCNDVGLLAEEYDPVNKRMLGNFPQAFSHVALINSAHNLSKPSKPAEQRSEARSVGPPR